jgi:tetrahydromethanopterin S-methyltransferase subunit F
MTVTVRIVCDPMPVGFCCEGEAEEGAGAYVEAVKAGAVVPWAVVDEVKGRAGEIGGDERFLSGLVVTRGPGVGDVEGEGGDFKKGDAIRAFFSAQRISLTLFSSIGGE